MSYVRRRGLYWFVNKSLFLLILFALSVLVFRIVCLLGLMHKNLAMVALTYAMSGEYMPGMYEAEERISRSLLWESHDPGANAAMALVLSTLRDESAALPYWEVAWRKGTRPIDGLRLGLAYESIGRPELAVSVWRKAGADRYFVTVGTNLMNTGRFDESRLNFERALKVQGCNLQAQERLGRLYLALGESQKAYRIYKEALSCDGGLEVADLHYGLAASLFQQFRQSQSEEQPDRAALNVIVDHLHQALALDPQDGKAYILLAQVLLDKGAREEALSVYEKGYREVQKFFITPPDSFTVHINLGILYWKDKANHAGAEAEFRRAIAVLPADPRGYLYLGDLLLEECRLDEAYQAFQKAAQRGTDISQRLELLKRAASDCGS